MLSAREFIALFKRDFLPSFGMSLSRPLDIPFAWLWLPQDILTKHGYPPEARLWLHLCGAGLLISLLAGLLCLISLPKGIPGRRIAMLSLFWSPFLLDFAIGSKERPVVALLYAAPPLFVCLALLGWKTVSLARQRRKHKASSRAIAVYTTGLLAMSLSIIAMFVFRVPELSRVATLSGAEWWFAPLSLCPEIGLVAWFFPLDRIRNVLECIGSLGGIWFCNIACVLLCWRQFGAWQDRKSALMCLLWFVYVFHFGVAFWIGGYLVRSVLLVFIPALAVIGLTVFRLVETIRNRESPGRRGRILLLAVAIPAELNAFLLAFSSISYSAFGASC